MSKASRRRNNTWHSNNQHNNNKNEHSVQSESIVMLSVTNKPYIPSVVMLIVLTASRITSSGYSYILH